jgi:hypothetical protein
MDYEKVSVKGGDSMVASGLRAGRFFWMGNHVAHAVLFILINGVAGSVRKTCFHDWAWFFHMDFVTLFYPTPYPPPAGGGGKTLPAGVITNPIPVMGEGIKEE